MSGSIFRSKIWLKLKNESDERLYFQSRLNSLKCWIRSLSILALLTSLINLYIQLGYISENLPNKQFPFTNILLITYICAGLNIILTVLILSTGNLKLKQNLYYFQYLSLGLGFFCLHFSFSVFRLDAENRRNIHGVESLIKILNYVVFLEYIDSILLTCLNLMWAVPVYAFFKNWDMHGFMYPYIFFSFSFICISYFIVYSRKTKFFYSEENRKRMDWFKDIIENMKSGFIHKKKSDEETESKVIDPRFFESEDNSKKVLWLLLSEIKNEIFEEVGESKNKSEILVDDNFLDNNCKMNLKTKKIDSNKVLILNASPDSDNLIQLLEEFKKKSGENSGKFTHIGIKTFQTETDQGEEFLTLEVFCRYNFDHGTKLDEFEIIFNDLTKAKQIQEKKSEMKYKSLFLSKVAHEFKNPLICIIELVNQLSENFKEIEQGEREIIIKCEDNLHQINSLSNYLMILIRDFDYFSQNRILNKKITLEKEECELKEILSFCKEIATSLLKRNGKENNLRFILNTHRDLPERITTDECRLKQVLVNLISNSIKFTNQGRVVLKVFRDNSDLVFSVSDTGVGIDVKNMKSFFTPYNSYTRSNAVNRYGSGLGMSIIYDLTNVLGKRIQFTSELKKGSHFYFSITIDDKKFASPNFEENLIAKDQVVGKEISCQNYISSESASNLKKTEESRIEKPFEITHFENEAKKNNISFENEKIFLTNQDDRKIEIKKELNLEDSSLEITEKSISSKNSIKNKTSIFPKIKLIEFIESSKEKDQHEIKIDQQQKDNCNNIQNNLESCLREIDKIDSLPKEPLKRDDIPITSKMLSRKIEKLNMDNKEGDQLQTPKEIDSILTQSKTLNTTNRLSFNLRSKVSTSNDLLSDYVDVFLNLFHLDEEQENINIIIVDDEKLSRFSNKRLISNYAKNKNLKVNFIEAEDGIECLYILYVCIKKGVKISCIISDQTMTYMNGSTAATVLKELVNSEVFNHIPFYVLTAYEDESTLRKLKSARITNIYTKPIKNIFIEKIFGDLHYIE